MILQWFGIWAELLAERTMIASSLDMFGLDMLKHVGLVVCWVGAHQAGPRAPVRTTDLGPNCCFHIIWDKNLVRASISGVMAYYGCSQTRTVYKKGRCRDRRRTLLPQAVMYIDWVWFRCLWTFKAFLVGTFFPHSGQSKPPVFKCLDSMWILTQLRCFEVYSQSLHPWLPSLVLSSLDVTRASIISPPTYSKN